MSEKSGVAMFRNILILAAGSVLLAACASTPSTMSEDNLVSTVVASPAPPPANEELSDFTDGVGGAVGEPSPEEVVVRGTGRGGVRPEQRNIELELSGTGAGGGGTGEGTIGIGDMGAIGSGGSGSAARPGFVYPAMGSAFAATRPETPYTMQASGEAPYWRSDAEFYELDGAIFARFSLVAADAGTLGVTLREAPSHLANGFRSYASADSEGPRVSANYQAGPCVDGLGVEREFFASIQVDDTVFEGCARETGGQWDWSRDLLTRYAEIIMCLDEVDGAVAAIDAYAPTPDNTAVRILRGDGTRFECLIVNDGQRLASVRELDATEVHLNEGRTLFMRDPIPGEDNCRSFESILGRDGELMGYLAHDLCQNPRIHVEGPLEPGES